MSKILRDEVAAQVPVSGGMLDLFDGLMYTFYNITPDELDTICEKATDEEMEILVDATGPAEPATISQIRKAIEIRNKYVEYFNSNIK